MKSRIIVVDFQTSSKESKGLYDLILASFFSKPQSLIDQELVRYGKRLHHFLLPRYSDLVMGDMDFELNVEDIAASFHKRMLEGAKIWKNGWLHEDLSLVAASLPAQQIAEMACSAATRKGKLARLYREMTAIHEEHGLDEDSALQPKYRPRSYGLLIESSEKLFRDVFSTVFVQVLDRYSLSKISQLFEQKPSVFEVRFEVGRRLLDPNSLDDIEGNKMVEQSLRDRFGENSVADLHSRLAACRLR